MMETEETTGAVTAAGTEETGSAGATGAETGGGGVDFDGLLDRFEERIGPRFAALEERIPEPQQEVLPEIPDPNSPDFFGNDDFEPDGSLTEEAQERHFWAMVDERAQRIAAQAVEPITQRAEQERREAEADALEERYVALRDPEMQERVLEEAVRRAQRLGIPPDQVNQVALEPAFIELTFLAMQTGERAAGEPGVPNPNVVLEQGGSAGPAEPADAPDIGDAIVKATRAGRFRLGG